MSTKQTDQSAELVPTVVHSSTDLAQLTQFDQIILGLIEAPEDVQDDPGEIAKAIILQLLQATTDEELQLSSATGWRELQGVPVEINGFRWRKSDFEEGSPVYVIVNGMRLDTGEVLALTTGSGNILAQLSNLARRDQFPTTWRLIEADKATKAGFKPLWLEKVSPEEATRFRASLSNPLDEL